MNQLAARPAGKAGDFDFLSGQWTIRQRRRTAMDPDVWDHFEGEATCWSILNGIASIEELRIPARNFSGMGLRLPNQTTQVWSDFWMNGKAGVLMVPGTMGYFDDGVGVFVSEQLAEGKPMLVRGMWDNISSSTCRWQQATSDDGGESWATNWVMDWTRAAAQERDRST